MKKHVLPVAVGFLVALPLVCSQAVAAEPPVAELKTTELMAVNIPFSFTVEQKLMPAGRYEIGAIGLHGDRLAIKGIGDQGVFVAPDREGRGDPPASQPTVVFDKRGDSRYLSRVLFPGVGGFTLRVVGGTEIGEGPSATDHTRS